MYAILLNGAIDRYPLSLAQVRRAFPSVSFAAAPDPQALLALGVVAVQAVAAPDYDPDTQQLIEGQPVSHPDGWAQTWTVTDLPPEEIAARLFARRAQMTCSPAQGRLALLCAGLLDAVETWVAAQSRATQIEYASRTEWRRDWPLVISAGTALGLSEFDLDTFFTAADVL